MGRWKMVQAHMIFSGTVQGVGFRFMVQRYAGNLGLNGWVKNLSDGSVESLVQGPAERIETLVREIESYFEGHIRNRHIQFSPLVEKIRGFCITH